MRCRVIREGCKVIGEGRIIGTEDVIIYTAINPDKKTTHKKNVRGKTVTTMCMIARESWYMVVNSVLYTAFEG